ncbi:MAG: type II secretion system protein [Pseudomonadota bacterium]
MSERRDRGFTLLETMVAFAILVLVLGAAYRSLGAGSRSAASAETLVAALSVAESALARIGTDLSDDPGRRVVVEGGWQIDLTIQPYRPAEDPLWRQTGLLPLTARVAVSAEGGPALATLQTLVLRPAR